MRLVMVSLLLLGGCVLEEVALEGKRCPCASGFVCDEAIDQCVRMLVERDAGPEDTGAVDSGPDAAVDAGSPDVAPIPECARDTECPVGDICVAGACEPACQAGSCGGLACDTSGHCFANIQGCGVSADCNPPEQVCVLGQCAPGCSVGSGSCSENRICNVTTGFCEAAPRCSETVPCPDRDFVCGPSGHCVRRCDATGAQACRGNTTCAADGLCMGIQLGELCLGDAVCGTGLCFNNDAPSARFCSSPCGQSADCPLGFGCEPQTGYSVCVPDGIYGDDRYADPGGAACMDPGNTCQSQICDPSSSCVELCSRDAHCAPFGTDCVLVERMFGGSSVFTRECTAGPGMAQAGAACTGNTACASGICNRYTQTCNNPCCTDADCGAFESCVVYDIDSANPVTTCQDRGAGRTALGMPCNQASECESGVCTPRDPGNIAGPRVCSIRCCSHQDCRDLASNAFCQAIPGVLPGTSQATCFAP